MTKTIVSQFIRPITIFFILYLIFYFAAFLSGYGANNKHINEEVRLFIYFGITHLVITFLYFIKERKLGTKFLLLAITEVLILWTLAAWNFGYFSL